MTYKHNTPTFNTPNRWVFNFKGFLANKGEEKSSLKKMRRSFRKNDGKIGQSEVKSKYDVTLKKNVSLSLGEVNDKIDSIED